MNLKTQFRTMSPEICQLLIRRIRSKVDRCDGESEDARELLRMLGEAEGRRAS